MEMRAAIAQDLLTVEDESVLKRIANYIKRTLKKSEDPTLMTKEEFFKRVDRSLQQAKEGKGVEWLPGETYQQFKERTACSK